MRVDEQLLAGLRILDDQKAQVRQLHFQRIVESDGDDIMPARKLCERLRPAGRADEIGDDENERAPRRHAPGHLQQVREVRGIRTLDLGPRLHPVQQVQHLAPAAARGNYGVDAIAVEERADPVAVRGKDARQHGHEIVGHRALLDCLRAESDRWREIEQEPRGDFAFLVVFAHVGCGKACRDVPVDMADVIVIDVLAKIGQIEPVTAKQRAVVAVEHAVEPTDHRPLEPPQDCFRRSRWRTARCGHGSRAAYPAPAPAA